MVRDPRGSIGDGEIGTGARAPASSRLISLWVRSYAPWREHSRRLGSLPNLPRGYLEWVWSARGGDGAGLDANPGPGARARPLPFRARRGDRNATHPRVSVAPTFQTYVRPPQPTLKNAVGPMFRKADPDHMLSSGTTYVRITGASFATPGCRKPLPRNELRESGRRVTPNHLSSSCRSLESTTDGRCPTECAI